MLLEDQAVSAKDSRARLDEFVRETIRAGCGTSRERIFEEPHSATPLTPEKCAISSRAHCLPAAN